MNNKLRDKVEPVVDGKFVRAWINLDKFPGNMMNGPDGIFGPIPATTSCRITTSERELACWKSHAEVYLHPPKPAAQPVTMDEAIAAGNGTLHGAIDYWQERALKAEAAQPQVPEGCPSDIEVREAVADFMKDTQTLPLEDCAKLLVMRIKALLAAAKEEGK